MINLVECQCYIGASYLQAYPDGNFHNVFSLADPKGNISRIYKSEPASFEAFFFSGPPKFDLNGKPFRNPRVIETEFGRVGIQICYENLLYDVAVQMRESKPDLIVSPFSCPIALPHKRSFPARDALYFNDVIDNIGGRISHLHKVPTVYCNKTGLCRTDLPMATITGYPKVESTYPGKCSVWDNQGTVLDQLNREFEGVLIGNVTLKTTVKGLPNIPCCPGGFIIRPVFTIRMFRVIEWIGRMSYGRNQIRYDKAREICAGFKNSPLYRTAAAPLTWSRLARDYLVLAGVISWCYVQSKQ